MIDRARRKSHTHLVFILLVAVALRLAWRIHKGGDDFWVNGYSFFYEMAKNIAAGHGFHLEGGGYAMRVPVYPAFLAFAALVAGKSYLWIVVPQALMGAGTVLCAYLLGRDLFGERPGLLAAFITAIYPYYVVHDTALQETGMFTFLTTLSILLLLRAAQRNSERAWPLFGVAGVVLGLAVLTRQTLAPFALTALAWIGVWSTTGSSGQRARRLAVIALPFAAMVGFWIGRNYLLLGAPVLTSELGRQVWNANNAKTFSHYPEESIDRSAGEAFDALSPVEERELEAMSTNEIAESDWFLRKGLAYIRAHRLETLERAGRKLAAGFSWRFNPVREPVVQAAYLASYGPVSILGAIGMFLTRRRWRELGPIYLLFLNFAAVTAVFWAHTSHRSYLDVYLIIFAAYTLQQLHGAMRSSLQT